MTSEFIEVIKIEVLTLATKDGTPDDRVRPILRLELKNGKEFFMSGIPIETAYNISYELAFNDTRDSRMQIYELVGQLALIKKVEIDIVVPGTTVYQATLTVLPEGFTKEIKFQMVPSNAILLAVANDSPVFVAEELINSPDALNYS